jgi:replicative DNA helicase
MSSFDTDKIEYYIIKSLITSDTYCRFFFSKLGHDLFSERTKQVVIAILRYFNKYSKVPTIQILEDNVLPAICGKNEDQLEVAKEALQNASTIEFDFAEQYEWLKDETKKFVKTRRIMNAIIQSVDLLEQGKDEEIVTIMERAFQVDFDESLGIEYFDGMEERLIRAAEPTEVMCTGYKSLDSRVGGGYRRKSMFVFAAASNVGKTLVLNDSSFTLALCGYNVIYLSLELGEDYIQQRTDAKFAEVSMNEINVNPEFAIKKAIAKRDVMKKENATLGKMYYKEYAPNSVCANDIKALLRNLELKKGFKPDFIIVDYLKLVKPNGKAFADNTYGRIVTVCEELRSLAFEYDCCVLSAAQTGRQSYNQTSVGMEDISDSIGIAQTVDVLITLARNPEMDQNDDITLKIAKSRFSRNNSTFMMKIDYDHMRLVDTEDDSGEKPKPKPKPKAETKAFSKPEKPEVKPPPKKKIKPSWD